MEDTTMKNEELMPTLKRSNETEGEKVSRSAWQLDNKLDKLDIQMLKLRKATKDIQKATSTMNLTHWLVVGNLVVADVLLIGLILGALIR